MDAPFVIRPLREQDLAALMVPAEHGSHAETTFRQWLKAQGNAFSCGDSALDRYLRTQITQDSRRDIAKPFVVVEAATGIVAGYYTLSTASVRLNDLPPDTFKRLPRYPDFPAVLIGRLAIDQRYQGQGLGCALLIDIYRRTRRIDAEAAVLGVIVDAADEVAQSFYEKHQFQRSPVNPHRLILPMQTIRQLAI